MKKWMSVVLILIVVAGMGGWLLPKEAVLSQLESFAMRHADKLPLVYLGGKLFDRDCAGCHDNPATHAPTRKALEGMSKESIMIATEFGKMQPMAAHLSKQERGLIALYLTRNAAASNDWIDAHRCSKEARADAPVYVANWGLGQQNRRFVSPAQAGIDRHTVASLKLSWTLALPRVTDMRSQPVIVGDTLYLGDKAGMLYALNRHSGCVYRHRKVLSGIRSALTLAKGEDGRDLLVFADSLASIFAVDPATFDVVWQVSARLFDTSVITGSISYGDGHLYVPVSSYEVAVAGSPTYACCHSHGAVLALEAATGKRLWRWDATPDAVTQGVNSAGVEQFGPAGASVWSTPAIDAARDLIYVGTGENLSPPATSTSDAIIALNRHTGELVWQFQATANDIWNAACLDDGPNCPENPGGDFDFGASVIIADRPGGGQLLLAGQKSGEVFAFDPDANNDAQRLIWRRRLSQGTTNGGIHWGMALVGDSLLVAVADPERERPGYIPRPGISALAIGNGEIRWQQSVARDCEYDYRYRPLVGLAQVRKGTAKEHDPYACSFYYGLSAALTATDQLVFGGALDGRIRAWDVSSGEQLWQARTAVAITAGNGLSGHGGAIDVAGQVIADGWVYVLSGYSLFGQLPGNLLLAYKVVQEPTGAPNKNL